MADSSSNLPQSSVAAQATSLPQATISPQEDLPQVDLGSDTTAVNPPPTPVAQKRAEKADMGGLTSAQGIDYNKAYTDIANGKEPDFRQVSATTLNFKAAMAQEQAILDAYKRKGSSLNPQDVYNVLDPFNPGNTPANPLDVIERAYATNYISAANTADGYMKDTVYNVARKEIPEQLKDKEDTATGAVTKMEVANTLREDLDNEIHQQGWVPWAVDQAKTMFQPYNEFKLRGNDPEIGKVTGGLLLGNNLQAQADDLWLQPTDQAVKNLHDIVTNLRRDNPTVARQFLDYFIGQSTNQRVMDNIFTMISPTDMAAFGKGGVALAKKIAINNRAGAAFKQMVADAAKQDTLHIPVKAVAQEAAGDVQGAAATRAAASIQKLEQGTLSPVIDTKESLMSGFRLDGDMFDSNPGNLSREQLTRWKDSFYQAGDKLYDAIQNVLKVIRTPVPLRNPDALRAYMDVERTRYKGLENAVLDIHSPVHMPETNTYWLQHDFGNEDGRLFSDPETAQNWAKKHGFAEAHVQEASGTVEKQAAGEVLSGNDLRRRTQLNESIPMTEQYLAKLKDYVSKQSKFVGPKSPESIQQAREAIKSISKDILPRYKEQLADIAKRTIKTDPIIEQNGVGYKVSILRPYREDDPVVRQWLVNDKKAQSTASMTGYDSWKNSWLGWVRTADDTLAYNDSLNRKIANYTQSVLRRWASDEAKSIEDIANKFKIYNPKTWFGSIGNKQMFEEFHQALRNAKDIRDPVTKELGYFFKTPGELQDHYQRWFQRLPTEPEMQAYFSHVKILEANRVLSEIAEFRNRARIGAEQHQIYFLGKNASRIGSGFFDAIDQKEFPGGKDQILVLGGHQGEEKLYRLGAGEIPGETLKKLREDVQLGHAKILRIYDPDSRPLKGWSKLGDNRIRYVYVTDSESKPLAFNHINRRGGGHFDVDSDWYVKQANMIHDEEGGGLPGDKRRKIKSTYLGDRTFSAVENRLMGKDVAIKMTRMNELMRTNQIDEAKALAKHLGIEWDKVEGWYKPKVADNGHVIGPPNIDWNEPFRVVPRNKKIYDLDKDLEQRHGLNFVDGTKSGSDALQFKVAYSEARDSENLHTFSNSGTHANPVYNFKPATYVDPIPSLNRAMNRAISSTFMDDYKIHAIEQWISEAAPYMKDEESAIRSAPFWYFNNADRGAFKPASDLDHPGLIDNLLSNRFKIRQFVGMPNKLDTYIHGATQLLVDKFYEKLGSESERSGVTKAFTVAPLWAISKITDSSALRSFAFNAKLGLFAVPQFLVQTQTFANIWAISPTSAPAGTVATMLHTWARLNKHPEVIAGMDRIASKFGWKLGEFKEANAEMAKTGFEHVGGEYMLADDQMQHKFFRNQWGNFLDAGQVFFKEGERANRIGAYYTAFHEWRKANPTKVLTDYDRGEILQKADLLTVNMSRASASIVNSSLLSLPVQFLSYQIRLGEQFLGKRLGGTTTERMLARARLVGFFGALYGLPNAIGVTGYPDGAVPFVGSIREYAINHGYVVGDNQLQDIVMQGFPAWSMAMISGGLDYRKGNQYNFGDRMGSQGLTLLRELNSSDETVWKLVTGAAGSTIGNTIASFDPVWQAMKYMVSDDEEGNYFKLTASDFSNMFSEISSVDSAKRLLYAMHTGRWLGHNEQYIEDVTGLDALYRTITGLHAQQQDDIWSLHNIRQQDEDNQKAAAKEITKDYHRGIQATADNDNETAKMYFTRARARMIASGIPLTERPRVMSNASRNFEPQIQGAVRAWAEKNVPYGQEQTREDAYSRFLQLQDYRNH